MEPSLSGAYIQGEPNCWGLAQQYLQLQLQPPVSPNRPTFKGWKSPTLGEETTSYTPYDLEISTRFHRTVTDWAERSVMGAAWNQQRLRDRNLVQTKRA